MNLLLLEPGELPPDGLVKLAGRRAVHVLGVLRPAAGDRLQIGVLGGRAGTGEVVALDVGTVTLRVTLTRDPPRRAPVDLLLALPRPKILRKVLQAAAAMGLGRLILIGSYRVEKSYFGSPLLAPEALAAELRLGLEQGLDTIPPEVTVRRFFKPFVEDELDAMFPGAQRLLANPAASRSRPGGRRRRERCWPSGRRAAGRVTRPGCWRSAASRRSRSAPARSASTRPSPTRWGRSSCG